MKANLNEDNDHRRFRPPPTGKSIQYEGQHASAMIFELLNPLDNIYLSAEMLKAVMPGGDSEVYLDVITRNATRIDHLIKTFLVPVPPPDLPAEENSFHQLLNEVLKIANERITRKQIIISKEYAAPVVKTVFNRQAMKIALTIILINAINGIDQAIGHLKLKTISIHDKFFLIIEDNGPFVNQQFQEVDDPGLSLATAFYILRSNNIGVDVEPGKEGGTIYTLMFKGIPLSP